MGTDIHPIVEVWSRREAKWVTHRPTTPYKYATQWKGAPKYALPDEFSDRNYFMFAVLGDVRNDYGVSPISKNRGLPSDIAAGTRAWANSMDHSPGYVTLAELEAFDWSQTFMQEGVISESQFIRCLVEGKSPRSWSGATMGPNIVTVTSEQYADLYGKPGMFGDDDPKFPRTYDRDARYFIAHRWNEFYMNAFSGITTILAYLRGLVPPKGTSADVRLLFYFDS